MPTLTITYSSPEERRDYERAIGFVAEMRELGLAAPHGGVIDACEALCLSRGRDLLRDTLAGAVQARVSDAEKILRLPVVTEPAARGGDHGPL
jgi:hypothetical protein